MALDFALPAAGVRILDEGLFGAVPPPQPTRVQGGGDELRARQVKVALARALGGKPQAMTKLQFGFQEVGGEPLDGIGTDGAGAYRLGGRPGDGGTGGEHGLVVGQHLGVADLGVDHRHAGAA